VRPDRVIAAVATRRCRSPPPTSASPGADTGPSGSPSWPSAQRADRPVVASPRAAAAEMVLLLIGALITHRRRWTPRRRWHPALLALAITLAYLAIAVTS
jgi:hypothetical protein